jgi:hypothetical protein
MNTEITAGGIANPLPAKIDVSNFEPPDRGEHTSASNAPADELCQGRHLAQRGLPDLDTEDSQFGTQIHTALKNGDPAGLDPDQLSIYEGCVEIADRLIADKFGSALPVRVKERRFWWKSSDGKIQHSGQVDLLVTGKPATGLLIEYKTLPGDVAGAATNQQLRDQVAMVAGSMGLQEIDVAVVQPLVTYNPDLCRYDRMAIVRAQNEMAQRVRNSNNPLAPRVAGPVQCKFCKARFTCKEYHAWVSVSAPASMSSLTIPVSEWTPSQRALFCERMPTAMKWLEECKHQLKELLKADPNAVPGWKVGTGRRLSTIINPTELHNRFLAAGGSTDQFMQCVEIAKGKFETQLRAVTALKGKALNAKKEEILAGIIEEKLGEGSLEAT